MKRTLLIGTMLIGTLLILACIATASPLIAQPVETREIILQCGQPGAIVRFNRTTHVVDYGAYYPERSHATVTGDFARYIVFPIHVDGRMRIDLATMKYSLSWEHGGAYGEPVSSVGTCRVLPNSPK
jgi:hypothetical protein